VARATRPNIPCREVIHADAGPTVARPPIDGPLNALQSSTCAQSEPNYSDWSTSGSPGIPIVRGVLARRQRARIPYQMSFTSTPSRTRSGSLSERECEVLEQIARGHSIEDISSDLFLSPHTVRTHIKNILRKMGARTRAHAVAMAISDGIIDRRRVGAR
jgi:DNA-binding CsgD family transcriptional regulator